MDLGAYAQTEKLKAIAKANGIDVPRLRGYRLIKNEKPVSREEIKEIMRTGEIIAVKTLCETTPFWNPNSDSFTLSDHTDRLKDYFLVTNEEGDYSEIRWDRIHGWKRRILKFEIKKQNRDIQKQYDLWNKYAGKEGVLYIHSRMGGNNWKYFDGKSELMNQPWFLDRVDDWFDSTYCDFYARINV